MKTGFLFLLLAGLSACTSIHDVQAQKRNDISYRIPNTGRDTVVTGNSNYLPTGFRWGVLAGIGRGELNIDHYQFETQTVQGFFGLFADLPVWNGISIHPELTYHKYAFNGIKGDEQGGIDAAYNRQVIAPAVLCRYTLLPVRGKVLPFVQGGIALNVPLSGTIKTQRYATQPESNTLYVKRDTYEADKMSAALIAGVGVEYKAFARHSLFFDVRYRRDLGEQQLSGFYLSLSCNL
jgi:hypothetical protein